MGTHLAVLDFQQGMKGLSASAASTAGSAARTGIMSENAQVAQMFCKEGRLDKALVCLHQEELVPSVHIYKTLLQACMKRKALEEARQVHAHLAKHGLESNRILGDLLVSTLVSCGSLVDGLKLFRRLSNPSAVSWTAIIAGYCDSGQYLRALSCYEQMVKQEGAKPDTHTFVTLLKVCSRLEDLEVGRRIHADVVGHGFESNVFIASALVSMYAKCGSIEDAELVFHASSQRNAVCWNAIIAAYAQHGQGEMALRTFWQMQEEENVKPDTRTFVSALQACGSLAEKLEGGLEEGDTLREETLQVGRRLHAEATAGGFESDEFVRSALVSMYSKCGSILDARQVFDGLTRRTLVSWNAILTAYAKKEQGDKALEVYRQMQKERVKPDGRTVCSALQACSSIADGSVEDWQGVKVVSLRIGKAIHADAVRHGLELDTFVGCALVSMYSKCRSIADAQHVFDRFPHQNVVSWTAMIAAYAQQGQGARALQMFSHMQEAGVRPNARTFVAALQACTSLAEVEGIFLVDGQGVKLESLQTGREIHARARGLEMDIFVGTALISLYAKCGSIKDAELAFDALSHRNVVTWSAMIAAYAGLAQGERALQVYRQMRRAGVRPNSWTLVGALQSCALLAEREESTFVDGRSVKLQSLLIGRELHAEACVRGLQTDLFVASSLVSTYAKCGSIKDAEQVFGLLSQHDAGSWTAMISAYAQQGQGDKALQLYAKMQSAGVKADVATIVSVLEACSSLGALAACRRMHQTILDSGLECSSFAATSLIHAYGKCGSMGDAQLVFNSLPHPDMVSWNALIGGYARAGCSDMSVASFELMCRQGVRPDKVTFLALLSACSHGGMVDKGLEYFESMTRDHDLRADLEHYACVIDLVARAGLLCKAEELLSQMPMVPDGAVWLSVLGACQKHGNMSLATRAFKEAVALQPSQSAAYALMSNICADAGRHDAANEIDELRRDADAWKKPGQSWIECGQEVHTFLVRDGSHQHKLPVYEFLDRLNDEINDCN